LPSLPVLLHVLRDILSQNHRMIALWYFFVEVVVQSLQVLVVVEVVVLSLHVLVVVEVVLSLQVLVALWKDFLIFSLNPQFLI